MGVYVLRRLLQSIPLLLVISLLVFLLIHAAPGGPLAIYLSNPNVRPEVLERLPATLELTGVSLVVALLLTFPAGVFAAVLRGRWFDRLTTALAVAGISLPAFWFALMLEIVFA